VYRQRPVEKLQSSQDSADDVRGNIVSVLLESNESSSFLIMGLFSALAKSTKSLSFLQAIKRIQLKLKRFFLSVNKVTPDNFS
jgi:hypothetical protein